MIAWTGLERPSEDGKVASLTKRKRMRGTVEKIIKSQLPNQPEKAEIIIEGANDLYREIRIENVVTDEKGDEAQLKP